MNRRRRGYNSRKVMRAHRLTLSPPTSRTPSGYSFASHKEAGLFGNRWLVTKPDDGERLADFVAPDDDQFLVSVCTNSMFTKGAGESPFTVGIIYAGWLENGDFYQVLDLEKDAVCLAKNSDKLSEHAVLNLGLSLIRALKHLHKNEFVHGAICPEAIYAVNGRYKLGEYWWAHTLTGKTLDPDLFQYFPMRVSLSALRFFAPEVLLGFPPQRESDIYALGALMYYLLTGETPCRMPSETEPMIVIEKLAKESPRSILDFNKNLSKPTVLIIEKLLDKDADNRSNIFRFEEMLAAAVGEEPAKENFLD